MTFIESRATFVESEAIFAASRMTFIGQGMASVGSGMTFVASGMAFVDSGRTFAASGMVFVDSGMPPSVIPYIFPLCHSGQAQRDPESISNASHFSQKPRSGSQTTPRNLVIWPEGVSLIPCHDALSEVWIPGRSPA